MALDVVKEPRVPETWAEDPTCRDVLPCHVFWVVRGLLEVADVPMGGRLAREVARAVAMEFVLTTEQVPPSGGSRKPDIVLSSKWVNLWEAVEVFPVCFNCCRLMCCWC